MALNRISAQRRCTRLDSLSFQAAVFDAGGLHLNGYRPIQDAMQDISAEWVATKVSSNLQWIDDVVPEAVIPGWARIALPARAGPGAMRRRR